MEGKKIQFSEFSLKNLLFGEKEDICVTGGTRFAGLEVMPCSFASVVPPPEAAEGIGTSLQLNKTVQGVTSGEQQPKGTPGRGLGSLGSHTASGPLSSCRLAAFHRGLGIGVCVWKTSIPQGCLEKQPE